MKKIKTIKEFNMKLEELGYRKIEYKTIELGRTLKKIYYVNENEKKCIFFFYIGNKINFIHIFENWNTIQRTGIIIGKFNDYKGHLEELIGIIDNKIVKL